MQPILVTLIISSLLYLTMAISNVHFKDDTQVKHRIFAVHLLSYQRLRNILSSLSRNQTEFVSLHMAGKNLVGDYNRTSQKDPHNWN